MDAFAQRGGFLILALDARLTCYEEQGENRAIYSLFNLTMA